MVGVRGWGGCWCWCCYWGGGGGGGGGGSSVGADGDVRVGDAVVVVELVPVVYPGFCRGRLCARFLRTCGYNMCTSVCMFVCV